MRSSVFNYGLIEAQVKSWINQGYTARLASIKGLDIVYNNLDLIDERLEKLYNEMDLLGDQLCEEVDGMSYHSFLPDIKNLRNGFLDLDHNELESFNDLEAYTLYLNRILEFHCNLLNQAVLYDLFEEKLLIKRFQAIKEVFTGENGDILNELASSLFSHKGHVKINKLYQINTLFNQTLSTRLKKHLNFIFVVKEVPKGQRVDFLRTKLNTLVSLKSDFDGSLRILFNEKTLSVLFEILAQLLKISKTDQLISKLWTKLKDLEDIIADKWLFRQLCVVLRTFIYFFRDYKQYIYHFVIEGAFKKLIKTSKTALTFNELFNVT